MKIPRIFTLVLIVSTLAVSIVTAGERSSFDSELQRMVGAVSTISTFAATFPVEPTDDRNGYSAGDATFDPDNYSGLNGRSVNQFAQSGSILRLRLNDNNPVQLALKTKKAKKRKVKRKTLRVASNRSRLKKKLRKSAVFGVYR